MVEQAEVRALKTTLQEIHLLLLVLQQLVVGEEKQLEDQVVEFTDKVVVLIQETQVYI